MLVYQISVKIREYSRRLLTIVYGILTNLICAEDKIKLAQNMAEQPSSELAATIAVIG